MKDDKHILNAGEKDCSTQILVKQNFLKHKRKFRFSIFDRNEKKQNFF